MSPLRAAVTVAVMCLGCRFELPATGDGPREDAARDAEGGTPPDAYVHACLTDPSYTPHPTTGRRYKLHPQPGNYDDGVDRCAVDGAHLAVIESASENDFLDDFSAPQEPWIGFDDLDDEDIFRWVTGAASIYFNWESNEPNDSNGEDCVYMRMTGKWNDTGCETAVHRPLCECDPSYVPPPLRACRLATTGFTTSASGRRLFARPAATFTTALADCQSIGAHLLVISDVIENIEMDNALQLAHWLGITDLQTEGTFRWINGSAATYHNWGIAVPLDDALDCAILQDGGSWGNVDCATTNPYVCECDPLPP